MCADAGDVMAPSADGAARGAMADAGLAPRDVPYLSAHGTGRALNDRAESAAILEVFGAPPLVSSTRSMHGHLIGAAGVVEVLACIQALREGVVAPTMGWEAPDPLCPLDVVPNEARETPVGACLSNALGFGGLDAVLALRRA
jgi:nodulation protein E